MWVDVDNFFSPPPSAGLDWTEPTSFQTKPSLCKSVIIQKCRAVRRAAATGAVRTAAT